jgi:threonine aldolase
LATGLIGLRFVTHLHVDPVGIDQAVECIHRFMASLAPNSAQGITPSGVY